jgi:hypothetical protein
MFDVPRVLQVCCSDVLEVACHRLGLSIGQRALPLAKAVPLVASLGSDLLSPALRPQLGRLEAVHGLAASVYGCCFCASKPQR